MKDAYAENYGKAIRKLMVFCPGIRKCMLKLAHFLDKQTYFAIDAERVHVSV